MKVVEISMYAFAPACAAVLADWGADVVKIVPPDRADPMMGSKIIGGMPEKDVPIAMMWEQLNRGKRCIGLDISSEASGPVLERLLRRADVLIINLLPRARARFRLDIEDVRAINPGLVYARASGHGARGQEKDLRGFDHTDFWARSGIAHSASQVTGEFVPQPGPAMGDVASGAILAGAISAALYRRSNTGEGGVIDVSLLSTGIWMFAPAIVASQIYGVDTIPRYSHADQPNPLVTAYKTRDGREIYLAGVQTEKNFGELVAILGVPHLHEDPRFTTGELRLENVRELIAELDMAFAARDLVDWLPLLEKCPVPWSVVQNAAEAFHDRQVQQNGFVMQMDADELASPLAASPAEVDGEALAVERAPQHAEHTETVLMELDFSWDEIEQLKRSHAIN